MPRLAAGTIQQQLHDTAVGAANVSDNLAGRQLVIREGHATDAVGQVRHGAGERGDLLRIR
jgi:hypothetical protein